MTAIIDTHGWPVSEGQSDAEACRFWLICGREGDMLADTGEEVADIIRDIFPDAAWAIVDGEVVGGTTGEDD